MKKVSNKMNNLRARRVKSRAPGHCELTSEHGVRCPVANCDRIFDTLRGLNSHKGWAHAPNRDERPTLREVGRSFRKWSDEELEVLARVLHDDGGPSHCRATRIYVKFTQLGFDRGESAVDRQLRTEKFRAVYRAKYPSEDLPQRTRAPRRSEVSLLVLGNSVATQSTVPETGLEMINGTSGAGECGGERSERLQNTRVSDADSDSSDDIRSMTPTGSEPVSGTYGTEVFNDHPEECGGRSSRIRHGSRVFSRNKENNPSARVSTVQAPQVNVLEERGNVRDVYNEDVEENDGPNDMGAVTIPDESERRARFVDVLRACMCHEGEVRHEFDSVLEPIVDRFELGDDVSEDLNSWLSSLAKVVVRKKRKQNPNGPKLGNRGLRKKFAYKAFQSLWRANRGRTARKILNGLQRETVRPDDIEGFEKHWSDTYDSNGVTMQDPVTEMQKTGDEYHVGGPVYLEEIAACLKDMPTRKASGPDNLSVKDIKCWPARILQIVVNLIVAGGKPPSCLKKSHTVFIPKKEEVSRPNDFRPISLSPVLLRIVNKILAKRIVKSANFDYRQKAFLPIDGIAENVVLLEAAIGFARKRGKPLYLATLDMKNAYGSVHHHALIEALKCNGADSWLVEYVKELYTDFQTTLVVGEPVSVAVKRGVLQGDPLSPVLFNMVIDQILRKIPEEIGFNMTKGTESIRLGGMAFADDLNLLAQSPAGLRCSLNTVESVAEPWGLEFNPGKCSYLAIQVHRQRVYVSTELKFEIGGGNIPGLKDKEPWRYLGAFFSSRGLIDAPVTLDMWLQRLKNCKYLKPQQKLYVLRVHLLPKLIHRLCFGVMTAKRLEAMDKEIRMFLKGKHGILHLPRSTPDEFFYARVKDGGLGLMRLRYSIPAMVLSRFSKFENSHADVRFAAKMPANRRRLMRSENLIAYSDLDEGRSAEGVANVMKRQLGGKVDAFGLKWASDVPFVHNWVKDGSVGFLTGSEFVKAIKLRINALPTRPRCNRGNPEAPKTCRAGCNEIETQQHCIQKCHRSHESRVIRHDNVVKTLAAELDRLGYLTLVEPVFPTAQGARFPDIVACKGNMAYVIDPQVVSDDHNPDMRHAIKSMKYKDYPEVAQKLKDEQLCEHVEYGSFTSTYRGIMSGESADFLLKLGVSKGCIRECVRHVLRGSIRGFKRFMSSISMIPQIPGTPNRCA